MSTSSEHYTLSAHEGKPVWFTGGLATIKASGALTGNVMSLVEFLLPPGFATPLHIHHSEDEAFYILEGAIDGILDGKPWHAEKDTFVWLPRDSTHGFAVVGEQNVRMLAITVPSGFDQFVVEAGDPAETRSIPEPAPLNFGKLIGAATKYGQTILGPLELA